MKLCKKCILPEGYPDISFDDDGICNYCCEYTPIEYFGKKKLEKIISRHANNNREYDCIVPVSGGRDSSFVLNEIVNSFSLKPLVFHYNSGFATERSQRNIKVITARLGVDLIEHGYKNDAQVELFRENILFNSKKSSLHVLRDICNGCSNGYKGGALKLAKERNISLIIYGNSKMEESVYKKYIFNDISYSSIEKIVSIISNPANFLKRRNLNKRILTEYPYPKRDGSVEEIPFFDFIEWDEKTIIKTIHELGWIGDGASTWRVDCKVHVLVDYLTYKICGYNEKDEMLSKQIREGKLSRDAAIDMIKKLREKHIDEKDKILELLASVGVDNNQVRKIIGL